MRGTHPEDDENDQEPKNMENHQAVLDLGPPRRTPDIDNIKNQDHGKHKQSSLVGLWVVGIRIVEGDQGLDDRSGEERSGSISSLP